MRPTANLMGSSFLALLLACTSPSPQSPPLVPHERVGTAGFSIEVPPGRDWKLTRTDFSLTLEHRSTSWMHVAQTVLICVSEHPLPSLRGDPSDGELAAQFLEAEKAILCESEAEEDVSALAQREGIRYGRKLYQLTYDIHSRYRSDDPAWAGDVLVRQGEITAYFPDGPRGSHFYCFEIRVIRRAGSPEETGILRLIDRVIDTFQVAEETRRLEPANLQSR